MLFRASNHASITLTLAVLVGMAAFFSGCRESRRASGGSTGDNFPTGGTSTALLEWAPPSENVDGSDLVDLEGYNLYYGLSSGDYSWVIELGTEPEVELTDLESGTYYFAITTVTTEGRESDFSEEVSKAIHVSAVYP